MRQLLFFFSVALLPAIANAQTEKVLSSKISHATVFLRGAELTHTASTSLTKGENEIKIDGLSPEIDINSLKIRASNGVVIAAYEFSKDFLASSKSTLPVLKSLEDSIRLCQSKLDKINIDLKINTNMIDYLQKGVTKNISGSEKGLDINELKQTMDYYKTKSEQMETLQTSLNKQKQEMETSIGRLKLQYQQESVEGNKPSGVLKLILASPQATNSTFTITYFTAAARWEPYYEINIASIDKPVLIAQKSKVAQATGLDWQRVKLSLSTATPSNGKVAPLFSTWFLKERQYYPMSLPQAMLQNSYSYNKLEQKELVMQEDRVVDSSSDSQLNSIDDYILESDNTLSVVYNIDLPYTIPGNGKKQNIDLQNKEVSAEYKFYCAPKLDTETYLLAEISDWEKLGLLSGKANITYDGTYIGETFIDAGSTHNKLTLTLGTDKRVVVKREKMKDYSTTKPLGSDIQQTFAYQITVKNNQNKAIRLVLKDQYPVSTQKKIEVNLQKDITPWTTHKEDVGVITWEEDFAPGATKTYKISYSVKYPKEMDLNL